MFVSGRLEENFTRASEFIPDRWLRANGDRAGELLEEWTHHPFASLPFSTGVRMCIGRRIAEMELSVLIAKGVWASWSFLSFRPNRKSFARLQRLSSLIVDAVLDGALDGFRRKLEEKVGVPLGVVEPASLDRALGVVEIALGGDAEISSEHLLVTDCGDIVVVLKDKTFILDVAVAWDPWTDTLEAMCTHKRNKYLPLVSLFRERQLQKEVKVLGLVFGARGLICPSTQTS
ncbi:hypothetical protein HPB49_012943 [Dermacentor silvarum]|uniref:Uncharacterized protein n=1 Tax=Dermacentor silvarum TaxID=543639 RepID=A0ACB8C3P9_DERSI|nr:hypothetical protein HPB49_012943 [Dermacentor silvarum]